HEVRALLAQGREGRAAVRGGVDLVAGLREPAGGTLAALALVIDEEDPRPSRAIARGRLMGAVINGRMVAEDLVQPVQQRIDVLRIEVAPGGPNAAERQLPGCGPC